MAVRLETSPTSVLTGHLLPDSALPTFHALRAFGLLYNEPDLFADASWHHPETRDYLLIQQETSGNDLNVANDRQKTQYKELAEVMRKKFLLPLMGPHMSYEVRPLEGFTNWRGFRDLVVGAGDITDHCGDPSLHGRKPDTDRCNGGKET